MVWIQHFTLKKLGGGGQKLGDKAVKNSEEPGMYAKDYKATYINGFRNALGVVRVKTDKWR